MLNFLYNLSLFMMFILVTLLVFAIAAIIHFIMFTRFGCRLAGHAAGVAPLLQSIIAAFAALSVTFLSSSVWQVEQQAREAVGNEARSLRLIVTYSNYVSGTERDAILTAAKVYAGAVKTAEWPIMTASGAAPAAEAGLAELYRTALAINITNSLRASVLAALDRLSTARDARLALAQDGVMPAQWSVVLILMLALFVTVAACHGQDHKARAIALTLVALAIGASLYGILAHDRPFVGYLAITPNPILRAAGV